MSDSTAPEFNQQSPNDYQESALSVQETAQVQIELRDEFEQDLSHLDQQWQQERDAMAYSPQHDLSLGINGNSARSLQAEYTERRVQHDLRQSAVEREYSENRQAVRNHGITLAHEFTEASHTIIDSEWQDTFHRAVEPHQGQGRSR